jgi:hypothetical protein
VADASEVSEGNGYPNGCVGVAYMYSNLSAEVSKRNFTGELGWRMNSVLAYALIKL